MVEFGRVNICVEVSMLSSWLDMTREGNIQQFFHIFAYLKKHHNTKIGFDTSVPDLDIDKLQRLDWYQTVYGDAPPGSNT